MTDTLDSSALGIPSKEKPGPGTPDLIRTLESGKQIAVQCGTEEHYWGPTENIDQLKPVEDARKCLEKLDQPIEIVVISNREIPTTEPNVKSRVIAATSEAADVRISPIDLAQISEFIDSSSEDPKVKKLLAEFFPEASENLKAAQDREKYRLAQDVANVRSTDASTLLLAIERAVSSHPEAEIRRDIIIAELDALLSYRVAAIPPFKGLHRFSIDKLPLAHPLGKVWLLVGLPKIGKSSILQQLIGGWSSFDIRYFNVPIDGADSCAQEVARELLRVALPDEQPVRLERDVIARRERLRNARPPKRPFVLIVDDANNLSDDSLRHISEIAGDLKRSSLFRSDTLACIFVSNKRLGALAAADAIVSAPKWESSELGSLLIKQVGCVPGPLEQSEKYLDMLAEMSGGHPLISIALAKKCDNFSQLIATAIGIAPKVGDDDLSREALAFLYSELLSDPDSQNFVQRLSVLVGRQDNSVLEAIRRVEPAVRTSSAVLLDRILTSAVEGDPENGYSVPPVFRDIARQRIDHDEQRRVYSEVAKTLLRPEGRVIQAERTISGITHAILAGEVTTAFAWTSLILYNALGELGSSQLEVLLDRLHFVSAIKPQSGLQNQFARALALLTLAFGYNRINQIEKSLKVLDLVRLDATPTVEEQELLSETYSLKNIATVLRATLHAGDNPEAALKTLQLLTAADIDHMGGDIRETLLSMIGVLVPKSRYDNATGELIRLVVKEVYGGNARERHGLITIAASVAMRAKEGDMKETDFDDIFGAFPISSTLAVFSHATYLLETGKVPESLPLIASAIATLDHLGYSNEWAMARLELTRGDAAYKLNDEQLAVEAYQRALSAAPEGSFEGAWASWRLGTLTSDERSLSRAAAGFKSLGFDEMSARAIGAQGALLVKTGLRGDGLSCFASLVSAFYEAKSAKSGPAVTVALAHITRLRCELTEESLPSEGEFPAFETSPYETVISEGRPKASAAMAFFILGETYRALSDKDQASVSFRKALYSEHRESELFSVPVIVERVLEDREVNLELLEKCVELVLNPKIIGPFVGSFVRRDFVRYCLFHYVDAELSETGETYRISALLRAAEKVLSGSEPEPYWYSEVNLRRAKVAKTKNERPENIVKYFRAALTEAQRVENASVMIEAGHALGFEYLGGATSLRELAGFQLSTLRGIEFEEVATDKAKTFSQNLYNVWRVISYSRLSESDLPANKLLRVSAVEMDSAGVNPDLAAKAMVILLCQLHGYKSASASAFASEIANELNDLPETVRELISKPAR